MTTNMERIRQQRARQLTYERGRQRLLSCLIVFAMLTMLWTVIW